jgi:hypothetical protein
MRRKPTKGEIAARAHELYEQHAAQGGPAQSAWLQATRELEAEEASAESSEIRPGPRARTKRRKRRKGS